MSAGKSNSGEGGEDPVRWDVVGDADDKGVSATFPYLRGLRDGDIATSRIKQARCSLEAFRFAILQLGMVLRDVTYLNGASCCLLLCLLRCWPA
jgi:hypothetical protein